MKFTGERRADTLSEATSAILLVAGISGAPAQLPEMDNSSIVVSRGYGQESEKKDSRPPEQPPWRTT
jgi:hypothetical protein